MSLLGANILWQPFFSPVAILGGASVVALLSLWSYARSMRQRPLLAAVLAAGRIALVAIVALLLMGPSVLPRSEQANRRAALHVMVDTSASMQTPDMAGEPRLAFAAKRWLSGETFESLSREYEVRLVAYDATARAVGTDAVHGSADRVAVGDRTNLADSLAGTLGMNGQGGGDGSAIVVLGDGRDTVERPLAPLGAMARARSLPVYAVPLGGPQFARDLAITATPQQEYLLAGEQGRLLVSVLQNNPEAVEGKVLVRCGEQVERRTLDLSGRSSTALSLPIKHDEPGLYEYEVELEPVAGELEHRNNQTRVFVEVTAARFKVLVLEGQPYWDTKYLAQSLRKDDRIELTQITHVTPERQQKLVTRSDGGGVSVPQTLDEWSAYDVVILGRSVEGLLSAESAALLPKYVAERGGRVVFVRGQAYDSATPGGREMGRLLAPIEPVVWGRGSLHGQKLALAPMGLGHPSFTGLSASETSPEQLLASLPELLSVPVVQREKVGALVLARTRPAGAATGAAEGQPALLAMPYERGMVVAFVGEGLWRWNLQARHQPELAGVFDAFWSNMIRWLVMDSQFTPGQDLSLRLSRRSLQVGEELRVDVVSRFGRANEGEPPGRLTVIDPDGAETAVALAGRENSTLRFTGDFRAQRPGVYRVRLEPAKDAEPQVETRFFAYDVNIERLMCAANPQAMRELADASGGQVLDPYRPEELPALLRRHQAAMLVPPRPKYVWDSGWLMVALLGWAGGEWLLRKRVGLV